MTVPLWLHLGALGLTTAIYGLVIVTMGRRARAEQSETIAQIRALYRTTLEEAWTENSRLLAQLGMPAYGAPDPTVGLQ